MIRLEIGQVEVKSFQCYSRLCELTPGFLQQQPRGQLMQISQHQNDFNLHATTTYSQWSYFRHFEHLLEIYSIWLQAGELTNINVILMTMVLTQIHSANSPSCTMGRCKENVQKLLRQHLKTPYAQSFSIGQRCVSSTLIQGV